MDPAKLRVFSSSWSGHRLLVLASAGSCCSSIVCCWELRQRSMGRLCAGDDLLTPRLARRAALPGLCSSAVRHSILGAKRVIQPTQE